MSQRCKITCSSKLCIPTTLLAPGNETDTCTMPPVKQNLFQVEIIPLAYCRLFMVRSASVISSAPPLVTICSGVYHSKSPV